MSYEVLARKWRPQSFDDVAGQDHVTTPLRNAIRSQRVPHAVLLTGPRGVGKTTLARILARCLNCEKGPTDTPCGDCVACTEITAGTSTDVQEIDAASRTSVDDVRELIEAIRYAPSPGKHRIFVVDEVHMLSTAAFNALLKTLEEPPPRSLFVFATTNPEKIPFTVLSRCQRYDLRRISAREIVEKLGEIGRAEGFRVSELSLLAIAREADGSMRDAQTLLDQVIAYGGTEIDDEQVAQVLDLVDRRVLLAILEACIDGEAARGLEACAAAASAGVDAKRLGENLLGLLRDVLVLRIAPDAQQLVEASDEERAELAGLAERVEPARLRRMFRALLKEQEDLAWAPRPFAVLEMAVVRLATLPAGDDVTKLLSRLEALEKHLGAAPGPSSGPSGGGSAPARSGGDAAPGSGAGNGPQRPRGSRRKAETKAPRAPDSRSRPGDHAEEPPIPDPPVPTLEPAPEDPGPPPSFEPDAPSEMIFERLRAFIGRENHGLHAALEGGRLSDPSGECLRIVVPHSFSAQRLAERNELLAAACGRFFGRSVRVEVKTASAGGGDGGPSDDELRRLHQDAINHPAVSTALDVLDGEIVEIRPIENG